MKKIAPTKPEIALLQPFVGLALERIHVPTTREEFASATAEIKAAGIVGFDTESKPTFNVGDVSEGPHVVQFALHDKAYLFQLHREDVLPFLLELLQSEQLIKVGFGLRSDRGHILAKLGVHFNAVVDLNTVFSMDGYHKEMGVRGAVALVFRQRFAKARHVTTSNWSQPRLTPQQMLYAANDAYAALKVLEALNLRREDLPIMGLSTSAAMQEDDVKSKVGLKPDLQLINLKKLAGAGRNGQSGQLRVNGERMHILITGGTGLIGQKLCKALLAEGHELTVLSRNPASVPVKCGAGVHAMAALGEWHPGKTFDAVINLAGEPIVDERWTARRKQVLWDSRVTLTEELVMHILTAGRKPAVLLSGSAVGYYGNRGDAALDEAANAGEDFAAQLCKAWEDAALAATQAGVRVCLLRTGLVLSNDGGLLGRMLPPFKLGLGARLGDGKQWMSWVHIDDYVAMLLRLLHDAQASGPYNMTAPQPATNSEFTSSLAKILHRPALFAAPALLLELAMGERAGLLLEGQKVLPGKISASGYRFQFSRLSDALSDLLRTKNSAELKRN